MLPQKAIDELKELYKKHTGKVLTEEEAEEIGNSLLTLVRLVYKPIPKKLLEQKKDEFPELYESLLGRTGRQEKGNGESQRRQLLKGQNPGVQLSLW